MLPREARDVFSDEDMCETPFVCFCLFFIFRVTTAVKGKTIRARV